MTNQCANCECKTFTSNPFKPLYCSICLHNHKVKNTNVSANAPTPPPKAASSFDTRGTSSNSKGGTIGSTSSSTTQKSKPLPPKTPAKSGSSPNLTSSSSSNNSPSLSSSGSVSSKKRPEATNFSSKTTSPSTSSPKSTSSSSKSSIMSKIGSFKDAVTDKVNTLREDFSSSSEPEVKGFEISGPTDYKHNTHIGITENGGISTRNIPDEWKQTFQKVDQALKSAGKRGVTRREATLILSAVLSGQVPNTQMSLRTTPLVTSPNAPALPPKPSQNNKPLPKSPPINLSKNTPSSTSTSNLSSSSSSSPYSTSNNKYSTTTSTSSSSTSSVNNLEIEKLREKIKQLEIKLTNEEKEHNLLSTKYKTLESKYAGGEKDQNQAVVKAKSAETKLEQLERDHTILLNKFKVLESNQQLVINENKNQETELTALKKSIIDNKKNTESDKGPLLEKISLLESKLKDSEFEKKSLTTKDQELDKKIKDLINQSKEFEQKSFESQVKIKELTSQLDSLKDALSTSSSSSTIEYTKKIQDLSNQFSLKEKELRESFEKQYNQKLSTQKTEIDQLSTNLSKEQLKSNKFEMELTSKLRDFNELKSQFSKIQSTNDQLQSTIDQLETQLKSIKLLQAQSLNISESNTKQTVDQIKSLTDSNNKLIKKNEEFEYTIDKLKKDSIDIKGTYEQRIVELESKIKLGINESNNQHDQKLFDIQNKFKSEKDDLLLKIKQLQQQLQDQSSKSTSSSSNIVAAQQVSSSHIPSAPAPPAPAPPPPPMVNVNKSTPPVDSTRNNLLESIRQPKELKKVTEADMSQFNSNEDDGSMVNILVRALIDRRQNMNEDDYDEDDEEVGWDE